MVLGCNLVTFRPFFPICVIDNLNVFSCVAKLIDGAEWTTPQHLHKDSDLIFYIQGMLDDGELSTAKVDVVEGYAGLRDGRVRKEDKGCNGAADMKLLTWCGAGNLNTSQMSAGDSMMHVILGSPLFVTCTGFFIAMAGNC